MTARADLIGEILPCGIARRLIGGIGSLRGCLLPTPLLIGIMQMMQMTMPFLHPTGAMVRKTALRAGDDIIVFSKCLLTDWTAVSLVKIQCSQLHSGIIIPCIADCRNTIAGNL
jgi:hypothetical protein